MNHITVRAANHNDAYPDAYLRIEDQCLRIYDARWQLLAAYSPTGWHRVQITKTTTPEDSPP